MKSLVVAIFVALAVLVQARFVPVKRKFPLGLTYDAIDNMIMENNRLEKDLKKRDVKADIESGMRKASDENTSYKYWMTQLGDIKKELNDVQKDLNSLEVKEKREKIKPGHTGSGLKTAADES